MEKDRFDYFCEKSERGLEDVFVNNPSRGEGGEVLRCQGEELVVKTAEGKEEAWDYRECEETITRRNIFPYR